MKKIMALVLAAMMLLACCSALAEAPEGYPEVKEGIDFGGADVTIYDYWSGEGARKEDPTEEEALQYAYRDWINETYKVNLQQKQGGDWGSNATEMSNFNSAPDGSLRMYIIEPGSVASLVSGGVVAAIPDTYIDPNADKWNAAEREFMTINGKLYGLYSGNSEPRGCLYFNKRVLQEAGIDWNTIYDLQKDGKWTWKAFEDMLAQITKDTDNDGVNDIYGILGSGDDMYVCAVFSNGGSFFDFDEAGKLAVTAGSENTIEALTWAANLWNNYARAQKWPEEDWNYFINVFKSGNAAFMVHQTYSGYNDQAGAGFFLVD